MKSAKVAKDVDVIRAMYAFGHFQALSFRWFRRLGYCPFETTRKDYYALEAAKKEFDRVLERVRRKSTKWNRWYWDSARVMLKMQERFSKLLQKQQVTVRFLVLLIAFLEKIYFGNSKFSQLFRPEGLFFNGKF